MRNRGHLSELSDDTEIDMTPMLDIVFIMLIFFIVSMSFAKETGVTVNRPSAQTAKHQDTANIFVAITDKNEIWIDKRELDIRTVRTVIEKLHITNPEGAVIIQADKNAPTGLLVRVMDQIRLAGVQDIAVAAATEQ